MSNDTNQDMRNDVGDTSHGPSVATVESDCFVISSFPADVISKDNRVKLDQFLTFINQIVSDHPEFRRIRLKPNRGVILDWYSLNREVMLCINRLDTTEISVSNAVSATGWCILRVRLSGSMDEILGEEHSVWEGINSSFVLVDQEFEYKFRGIQFAPMRSVALLFKFEWLKARLESSHPEILKLFGQARFSGDAQVHFYPVQVGFKLIAVTKRMVDHFKQTSLQPLLVEAMVLELLAHSLAGLAQDRNRGGEAVRLRESEIKQLERVKARLDRDFVDRPGLDELSHWVGSNRSKLNAGFRALYGNSVGDYCLKSSLALALTLLRKGERVGDVALNVGYTHQGSFSKAFKKAFGVTPSVYRKMGKTPK